jgi:hypothetical protein
MISPSIPAGEYYESEIGPETIPILLDSLREAKETKAGTLKIRFSPNIPLSSVASYYLDLDYPFPQVCKSLWRSCRILPDGTVSPCLHLVMGNITQQPLSEIWNGPGLQGLRKLILHQAPAGLRPLLPSGLCLIQPPMISLFQQAILGMNIKTLGTVLGRQGLRVHWRYLPRLAFLSVLAAWNTYLGLFEQACNGDKIEAAELTAPPIFILGYWRSGTTHLHNLLSLDPPLPARTPIRSCFRTISSIASPGARRFSTPCRPKPGPWTMWPSTGPRPTKRKWPWRR